MQSVPIPQQPATTLRYPPPPEAEGGDIPSITRCARLGVASTDVSKLPPVQPMGDPPHIEALTEHVSGTIGVPGDAHKGFVKVNVLLDSGSGVSVVSQELVDRLQSNKPDVALTGPLREQARVVNALGQTYEITTRTRPLCLTVNSPWGVIRVEASFVVFPGNDDLVIIGQPLLRQALGIDVMTQLKTTVERVLGKGNAGALPEEIAPVISTQTRVHMTVEAFRGVGQSEQEDAETDEVTDDLVSKTPRCSWTELTS